MKKSILISAFFIALVGALVWMESAAAQAPQPTPIQPEPTVSDDQVNAIAKQLYCPVCENIPLDVCQTTACIQWRDLIRQLLTQGKSPKFIEDYFVAQYGDRVLGVPPLNPLLLAAYILLGLGLLGGIYVVVRVVLSMSRNRAPEPPAPPTPDDPYIRQLEEELRNRK
jgi:cytochrome c-type biogenesis protein CcmH